MKMLFYFKNSHINTWDGYARYDGRSRNEYRHSWSGGDTYDNINAHHHLSQPNVKRARQIYGRMCRGLNVGKL